MIAANKVSGKSWVTLRDEEWVKADLVKRLMKCILRESGHRSLEVIGSKRILNGSFNRFADALGDSFSPVVAKELFSTSDYDIVAQLDTFCLENLLRKNPFFKLKTVAEKSYEVSKSSLLREVYECKVSDLLGLPFVHNVTKEMSRFYDLSFINNSILEVSEAGVDLLLVSDIERTRIVWENVDSEFFAEFLWKKSPNYIGKEGVKSYFDTLERMSFEIKKSPYKNLYLPESVFEVQALGAGGAVPAMDAPPAQNFEAQFEDAEAVF